MIPYRAYKSVIEGAPPVTFVCLKFYTKYEKRNYTEWEVMIIKYDTGDDTSLPYGHITRWLLCEDEVEEINDPEAIQFAKLLTL